MRWLGLGLLVVLTVVAGAAPLALSENQGTAWFSLGDHPVWYVIGNLPLWYLVTGLIVMVKRPWHQVGWLLILIGLGLAATSLPVATMRLDGRWYPWLTWVTGAWAGYFAYTALISLLVVFPDGVQRRSPRSRRIGWSVIAVSAGATLLSIASHPVSEDSIPGVEYPNPLGFRVIPKAVSDLGYGMIFALILGCVFWMWHRRGREEGETRRRYTLVLYAFAMLIVALIIGISLSEAFGDIAWWPALLGWFAIPVAFTVAIVRHGLYGIDRIVSRTVTYVLVAMVVGTVYAVPVITFLRIFGGSNEFFVAVSTLAAAAAFNPIRRRIQRAVDRRFNRSRYDADHEVEAFADHLRSQVSLTVVVDDLLGAVGRTMQPETAAVWIRSDAGAESGPGRLRSQPM